MKSEKITRMSELVCILREAAKAYYQDDTEIMTNYEYDKLYDELAALEAETGTVLAGSPTMQVGYEVLDKLPKEAHSEPMLSLDKTKSREALADWLGSREGLLSRKLDGLTIVLTYRGGTLHKALTRGNGEIGEIITANAKTFKNLPLRIPFEGELVLRGEAVITYRDFEQINREIPEGEEKYKNPRNLCSGSVRQLSSAVTDRRNVRFYAFTLVSAQDRETFRTRAEQLSWLSELGFEVVPFRRVDAANVAAAVQLFAEETATEQVPSDGLVLTFDDIAYGRSLGRTAKFPRDSIAFKWADEVETTTLRHIEWSASRTGLINPVAVFEPVELEGTTVSRASVHNISIMEELALGEGDRLGVYKANMIIPQISENYTRSGSCRPPALCPACHAPTIIRSSAEVKSLYCTNEECPVKKIKSFDLFAGREGLNIDGLSEATLEKLLAAGFLQTFADLFRLDRYREEIVAMEGFGEKSFEKLQSAILRSSRPSLPRLICALGIANIGSANAKLLCREFQYDLKAIMEADVARLTACHGIGEVIAAGIADFFASEKNRKIIEDLLTVIEPELPQSTGQERPLE